MTAPTSYAYQWKSGAANATGPGAATSSYTVVTADIGNHISCAVTASNGAGSATASSVGTATVEAAPALSAPVLPAVPTPNTVPTKINFGSFPGSGGPSPYVLVNSAKYMNIFPVGAPINLTLTASTANHWTCRDIYGNTSSGAASGTTLTPTPPAGGSTWPCGWYRIALTNTTANVSGGWGTQCGDGTFFVWNDSITGLPGPTQFPNGVAYSDASYGTWCPPLTSACGTIPGRLTISSASNPTSGGTSTDPLNGENTASIVDQVAYDANWFLKYGTTNRPHQDFVEFPNGTVDVVNVTTNTVITTLGAGAPFTLMVRSPNTCYVNSTSAGTIRVALTSGGTVTETWTGTTWGALVNAINAGSAYLVGYSSTPTATATTFSTATIPDTGFAGIASVVAAAAAQAATSGVAVPAFEGPYNEPDNDPTMCAAQMLAFKAACTSAYADATVIGPMPVTMNGALEGWISSYFAAIKANGYGTPNGLSFHTYNVVNGDVVLVDHCFSVFTAALNAAGFNNVPLWMTEGDGTFVNNYGAMSWRNMTHWLAVRTLLLEVHGIPLERQAHYYISQMGYAAVPGYLKSGAYQQGPVCHPTFQMWRGFIERTANATPPTRLTMPGAAAELFFGSVYTNPANVTVALMTVGQPTGTVTLNFGTSVAATVYDWAGNTVTSATAATLTVTVTDLPTYVVVPSGTTVTATDANSGLGSLTTNLALTATVHTSSTKSAAVINNGSLEDGYYYSNGGGGTVQFRDNVAPPTWFVLEWATPQPVGRVCLYGAPGWQDQDVPLQYNIYTWSGSGWTLQASYTNPTANSEPFMTSNATWLTFTDQWWDGAHNFDIPFTQTTTNAVRVDILNVSYGSDPDNAAGSPNAGQSGPAVCLREIQIYA